MAVLDGTTVAARDTRHEAMTRPLAPSRGAMDWDDVRVFLAVARQGSMRAAGRALGLSQPTIARRLAAFETCFSGRQNSVSNRDNLLAKSRLADDTHIKPI